MQNISLISYICYDTWRRVERIVTVSSSLHHTTVTDLLMVKTLLRRAAAAGAELFHQLEVNVGRQFEIYRAQRSDAMMWPGMPFPQQLLFE